MGQFTPRGRSAPGGNNGRGGGGGGGGGGRGRGRGGFAAQPTGPVNPGPRGGAAVAGRGAQGAGILEGMVVVEVPYLRVRLTLGRRVLVLEVDKVGR